MKAHIISQSTLEVKELTLVTDDGQEFHLEPTRGGFKVRAKRPLFVQWDGPCNGEILMVGKGPRDTVYSSSKETTKQSPFIMLHKGKWYVSLDGQAATYDKIAQMPLEVQERAYSLAETIAVINSQTEVK